MKRNLFRIPILLLALLLLWGTVPTAAADAKPTSLARRCTYEGSHHVKYMRDWLGDRKLETRVTLDAGEWVSVRWNAAQPVDFLYWEWSDKAGIDPAPFTVELLNGDGAVIETREGDPYWNGGLEIEAGVLGARLKTAAPVELCTLIPYTGGAPADFHAWEPRAEKLDFLVIATHPDDDALFMGNIVATYGAEKGYAGSILWLTTRERVRRTEALNGAWLMGLRTYPLMAGLPDIANKNEEKYGADFRTEDVAAVIAKYLRETRPEVVISHDVNGEYGHWQHKVVAAAVQQAVALAADPAFDPASAEQYGVWQVKKLYLHLYAENPIFITATEPLSAFGGQTGWDVAKAAYKCHQSQELGHHPCNNKDEHSLERFGLAFTAVGPDTGVNDLFEHIGAEAQAPEATEPEPTEPEPTEPEATEPEATEPETTEPEPTEPKATEPAEPNPADAEPVPQGEPAAEPEPSEPEAAEPAKQTPEQGTEPAEPASAEPAEPALPIGAEAGSDKPEAAEPTAAEESARLDAPTENADGRSDLLSFLLSRARLVLIAAALVLLLLAVILGGLVVRAHKKRGVALAVRIVLGILIGLLALGGLALGAAAVLAPELIPAAALAPLAEAPESALPSDAPTERPSPTPEPAEPTPPPPTPAPQAALLTAGNLSAYADATSLEIRDPVPLDELSAMMRLMNDLTSVVIHPLALSNADAAALVAAFPAVSFDYYVSVGDQYVPADTTELSTDADMGTLNVTDIAKELPYLSALQTVHLGTVTPSELNAARDALPSELTLDYALSVMGKAVSPETETLDLSDIPTLYPAELTAALPELPRLRAVKLGDRSDALDTLEALIEAAPELHFEAQFTASIAGTAVNESTETLMLDGAAVEDEQQLRQLIRCLPKLTRVSMVGCGWSDERMAALVKDYPAVKFVWEIDLGFWGKLRTDAVAFTTRSSKSADEKKYRLHSEDILPLQYCTDLVALDLGHQQIEDISCLASLTKLQVLILADNKISDISALASMPELVWVELFINRISDLSPLSGLAKLKDLNLCTNKISDLTPLYSLSSLERLWYSNNAYHLADHKALCEALPNCKCNRTVWDETADGWRKTERYQWMISFFADSPRYKNKR